MTGGMTLNIRFEENAGKPQPLRAMDGLYKIDHWYFEPLLDNFDAEWKRLGEIVKKNIKYDLDNNMFIKK
jgi:hypothetical protein